MALQGIKTSFSLGNPSESEVYVTDVTVCNPRVLTIGVSWPVNQKYEISARHGH
jgi:hypothetical protein